MPLADNHAFLVLGAVLVITCLVIAVTKLRCCKDVLYLPIGGGDSDVYSFRLGGEDAPFTTEYQGLCTVNNGVSSVDGACYDRESLDESHDAWCSDPSKMCARYVFLLKNMDLVVRYSSSVDSNKQLLVTVRQVKLRADVCLCFKEINAGTLKMQDNRTVCVKYMPGVIGGQLWAEKVDFDIFEQVKAAESGDGDLKSCTVKINMPTFKEKYLDYYCLNYYDLTATASDKLFEFKVDSGGLRKRLENNGMSAYGPNIKSLITRHVNHRTKSNHDVVHPSRLKFDKII